MQSVVGARLEEILSERGYTKVELCQMSGISRPTLDKLLAGTITSRTNYEKHITKVLQSLNMSPDMLLGNTQTNRCRVRSLRNMMHINEKDLAEFLKHSWHPPAISLIIKRTAGMPYKADLRCALRWLKIPQFPVHTHVGLGITPCPMGVRLGDPELL